MSNEQGAINIKVGQANLALIRKTAKKLGMPPSRLAKVLLMDAIAKVNSGQVRVAPEPQVFPN
jgi:hypothetical protein